MDTSEFRDLLCGIFTSSPAYRHGFIISPILKIASDSESRPSKSQQGKISYLRNKTRMQLSVRRYITRILGLHKWLSDPELDTLADTILEKITANNNYTIEILKGQAIQDAYRDEVGGHSCMTGSHHSEYVGLYRDNPKRIRMAVLRRNNSSARCIIWLSDDHKLYFDKIYTDYAHCKEILQQKLLDKDIMSCYTGSYNIKVSGLSYNDGEVPYMDTLTRGSIDNGLLDLSTSGGDFNTDNQDGTIGENDETCYHCECGVNPDGGDGSNYIDGVWVCESCYNDCYSYCGHCNEDYNHDNITFTEVDGHGYCENCISDVATECCQCDTWIDSGLIEYVDDDCVCNECFEEHYQTCEVCGIIAHNDNFLETGICCDCINISPIINEVDVKRATAMINTNRMNRMKEAMVG